MKKVLIAVAFIVALAIQGVAQGSPVTLLNVSYDPTRELYQDYNAAFAKYWKTKTGQERWHWPTTLTQSRKMPSCCLQIGNRACRTIVRPILRPLFFW